MVANFTLSLARAPVPSIGASCAPPCLTRYSTYSPYVHAACADSPVLALPLPLLPALPGHLAPARYSSTPQRLPTHAETPAHAAGAELVNMVQQRTKCLPVKWPDLAIDIICIDGGTPRMYTSKERRAWCRPYRTDGAITPHLPYLIERQCFCVLL